MNFKKDPCILAIQKKGAGVGGQIKIEVNGPQ